MWPFSCRDCSRLQLVYKELIQKIDQLIALMSSQKCSENHQSLAEAEERIAAYIKRDLQLHRTKE